LYKNRKRISNPERLSAWLVTTARREALKHIRQARNLSRVDERDLYRNPNPLPDEELEALELQAELELHIQNLDVRCQKLIHAIFFSPKNHTYQDLAAMLGISINALGPAKRRCLNRLRKIIEEGGSPDARISKKQAL
ncbi:MAG: sigma-70 family RNA polymerase sigma factor, partial [Candidatus Zixiibacteriota bacterium]